MKYLYLITILLSFNSFARSPAVLPIHSVSEIGKNDYKTRIFVKGKSLDISKVALKANGDISTKNPITKAPPLNLAPTFLVLFTMSIPFLAWVFIRDEEEISLTSVSGVEVSDIQENATVYEVDFNQKRFLMRRLKKTVLRKP